MLSDSHRNAFAASFGTVLSRRSTPRFRLGRFLGGEDGESSKIRCRPGVRKQGSKFDEPPGMGDPVADQCGQTSEVKARNGGEPCDPRPRTLNERLKVFWGKVPVMA